MNDRSMRQRKGMLVCLVNTWQHTLDDGYQPPPSDNLGIGYVAAVLQQAGYDVAIFDAYITPADACNMADAIESRANRRGIVLGFSLMCPSQLDPAAVIVRRLRSRGVHLRHVVAGGQFASTSYRFLLGEQGDVYDSVVYGEAEDTVLELMDTLVADGAWQDIPGVAWRDRDEIRLRRRQHNPDLRALPWPARHTLDALRARQGVVNIDTSRGCGSNCTFCMSRQILHHIPPAQRWRSRDPIDVVDEMEWIVQTSGNRRFNVTDENTVGDRTHRQRLLDLADEIESRRLRLEYNIYIRAQDVDAELLGRLRRAGLASAFVGIESFWQPTLDRLNKRVDVETNLQAIRTVRAIGGLRLYFGLMTFHPWVTLQEIRHNVRTLREEMLGVLLTGPEMLKRLLQVMLIYRGTPAYKMALRDGLVRTESRFDQGVCAYALPEDARRVLRMIKAGLIGLMQPQHELFLVATADDNRTDASLQAAVHALNLRAERHILDSVERCIEVIDAGAGQVELDGLTADMQRQTRALVAEIDTSVRSFPLGRGQRGVDQPDAVFLRETKRIEA